MLNFDFPKVLIRSNFLKESTIKVDEKNIYYTMKIVVIQTKIIIKKKEHHCKINTFLAMLRFNIIICLILLLNSFLSNIDY